MALVEIKGFNALIDNIAFSDQQPVNKQTRSLRKTYQNVKKWWLCNRKLIRLFALTKILQTYWYRFIKGCKYSSIPHQINFVGKLEEDGATMFFIAKKQQKTILNFSLDSLIVTE